MRGDPAGKVERDDRHREPRRGDEIRHVPGNLGAEPLRVLILPERKGNAPDVQPPGGADQFTRPADDTPPSGDQADLLPAQGGTVHQQRKQRQQRHERPGGRFHELRVDGPKDGHRRRHEAKQQHARHAKRDGTDKQPKRESEEEVVVALQGGGGIRVRHGEAGGQVGGTTGTSTHVVAGTMVPPARSCVGKQKGRRSPQGSGTIPPKRRVRVGTSKAGHDVAGYDRRTTAGILSSPGVHGYNSAGGSLCSRQHVPVSAPIVPEP